MKVRYLATGDVTDLSEDAASALIEAGICVATEKDPPKEKPPKKGDKPTKVEPLTTEDMPVPTKQVPA